MAAQKAHAMKAQTMHLGTIMVRYQTGNTWFDSSLQVFGLDDEPGRTLQIDGTDAVVALRDFLNSLDLTGRKLTLVKRG